MVNYAGDRSKTLQSALKENRGGGVIETTFQNRKTDAGNLSE